jgi:type IV pilus assembly protein PilP
MKFKFFSLKSLPIKSALLQVAVCLSVTACSSEQSELQAWMDEETRAVAPTKEKISEPKAFEPYRYENASQVDPFSNVKLATALDKLQKNKGALQPDLKRRREVLENFPLENIRMVGHLANNKAAFALLQAENVVYQAKIGNYLGQNFGVITKMNDTEVQIKELVQDAAGEWTERETALRIQEKKQ